MRDKIIEILAEITEQNTNEFKDETKIKEIPNFDSLQFVMMISELQERYNIEIPLEKAIEIETLGQLIECAKATD